MIDERDLAAKLAAQDAIAYGLMGPADESELTPSKVVWC